MLNFPELEILKSNIKRMYDFQMNFKRKKKKTTQTEEVAFSFSGF